MIRDAMMTDMTMNNIWHDCKEVIKSQAWLAVTATYITELGSHTLLSLLLNTTQANDHLSKLGHVFNVA